MNLYHTYICRGGGKFIQKRHRSLFRPTSQNVKPPWLGKKKELICITKLEKSISQKFVFNCVNGRMCDPNFVSPIEAVLKS